MDGFCETKTFSFLKKRSLFQILIRLSKFGRPNDSTIDLIRPRPNWTTWLLSWIDIRPEIISTRNPTIFLHGITHHVCQENNSAKKNKRNCLLYAYLFDIVKSVDSIQKMPLKTHKLIFIQAKLKLTISQIMIFPLLLPIANFSPIKANPLISDKLVPSFAKGSVVTQLFWFS